MSKKTKINNILLVLLTLNLMLSLSGCDRRKDEPYGQKISNHNITEVSAILSELDNFNGKTVTVEGTISVQDGQPTLIGKAVEIK